MKLLSFFTATLAATVSARPFRRVIDPIDMTVLKFAHVLEQLETEFYRQAIAKFSDADFTTGGFANVNIPKEIFSTILFDESAHVTALEGAIRANGDQPVTTCKFDFTSALTDVATMAATARVVEYVGVSAYMGAAPLMVNKELLTVAASILTVEARHQTDLNILNGKTSVPQAFDMALSPSQVLALVTPFVSGCDLGLPANPTLSVSASPSLGPKAVLTFESPALAGVDPNTLSCQMMVGGASSAISLPFSQCVVPEGINGPVYLFVVNGTQPLLNSQVNQAAGTVLAGPTLVFLDTIPETLGAVARTGSGVGTSTKIITPAEASAIVEEAYPAPTPTSGDYVMPQSVGGPNRYTGPSQDGKVEVIGWTEP